MTRAPLPDLAIVRIASAGGPYEIGDLVVVAYVVPTLARLCPLTDRPLDRGCETPGDGIPEVVSATFTTATATYPRGTRITMSFVDPTVARLHLDPSPRDESALGPATAAVTLAPPAGDGDRAPLARRVEGAPTPGPRDDEAAGRVETLVAAASPARNEAATSRPRDVPDAVPRAPRPGENPGGDVDVDVAVAPVAPVVTSTARPLTDPGTFLRLSSSGHGTTRVSGDGTNIPSRATTGDGGAPARAAARDDASAAARDHGLHGAETRTLSLSLAWTEDRASRFVRVVDKMFTVERLGWYRHVLALRLLVAETIGLSHDGGPSHDGARASDERFARLSETLTNLRGAGLEALGAPLLAAYVPGFAVTADWLVELDPALLPEHLDAFSAQLDALPGGKRAHAVAPRGLLVGAFAPHEFLSARAGGASLEALVPRLVPTVAEDPNLTLALERYRDVVVDLFSQIVPTAGPVRVRQMAQPNPLLDDRLWHVVSAVQQSIDARTRTPNG